MVNTILGLERGRGGKREERENKEGNYSIFLGRVAEAEIRIRTGFFDVLGLRQTLIKPRDRRRQIWKTVPASHVGSFDYPNDQKTPLLSSYAHRLFLPFSFHPLL